MPRVNFLKHISTLTQTITEKSAKHSFAYTAAGHFLDLYIVNHEKYDENNKQSMFTFLSKYNLEEAKERIRLLVSFFTILEISNLLFGQNQPKQKIYNLPQQWNSIGDGSN